MLFKIASLSRLSFERGIEQVIKALPLIKNDVEYYVGGEGDPIYKKRLIKICKIYGVLSKVHFVGRVVSPKKFFKDKTLVVNPILIKTGEEYGFSDLEALINRKALIRSWDKTQHVLRHGYNVYHINPVPEEIASAVDYLIDNPSLRKRLEENGYKTAQRINTLAIKQHLKFYRMIINS